MRLDPGTVRSLAAAALREDLGQGRDLTTEAVVESAARARGRIVARQEIVLAGGPVAFEVFRQLDPRIGWEAAEEGSVIAAGGTAARFEGAARAILTGERTALNFLQRLSGIATLARRCVREVEGTGAVILDTRKTTPTLRDLEKYAVSVGGASNHRAGLHDAVLLKDNHIVLSGGVGKAIARAVSSGCEPARIAVEVDDLEGLGEALEAGAGRVLLDNFEPEAVRQAVGLAGGRAVIECSGGLRPGRLRPYAEAGAQYLSLGCLTHSAPAADLSLELEETS